MIRGLGFDGWVPVGRCWADSAMDKIASGLAGDLPARIGALACPESGDHRSEK
jgi:hypothetical protein